MKRLLSLLLFATISYGALLAQGGRVIPNKPYLNFTSSPGYMTINELTGAYGLGQAVREFSKYFFGFTTIHGYQVNQSFFLGAGTGANFYNGGTLVPLFADIRYRFNIGRITPFVFGDGGLVLSVTDLNNGTKLFINPGFGGQYAIKRNLTINLGLGYWVQMGSITGSRDSFINIKAGISFKPN